MIEGVVVKVKQICLFCNTSIKIINTTALQCVALQDQIKLRILIFLGVVMIYHFKNYFSDASGENIASVSVSRPADSELRLGLSILVFLLFLVDVSSPLRFFCSTPTSMIS